MAKPYNARASADCISFRRSYRHDSFLPHQWSDILSVYLILSQFCNESEGGNPERHNGDAFWEVGGWKEDDSREIYDEFESEYEEGVDEVQHVAMNRLRKIEDMCNVEGVMRIAYLL